MATKTKQWADGSSATIQYGGQGDGQIIITSDPNNHYEARSMQITVETSDGSGIQRTIAINQAAKQRIDISNAVVTANNQTYSGNAKTPTPTVTLNGSTVPSSGYDVSYSNNTNAGTATITITGKGDYTGTATGTFTIAKASRTLSFADTYMVLNTSSSGTKTATPSAGSGDGAITYSLANTTYATINSSTGKVTSKTSDGSATVTATVAEGTNYLSASASYTLYVFATTHNYSYNGSYRSVTLPPGTYQFQVWGAQGGSNGANSTYGITAQAGGKGGYSVGQLTISQATGVRVYVGGQGSATAAGYNGGGSTTGSSTYNADGHLGVSRMGGGGGASDIRLSDGSLYSRMIVAGGGSGGAMCYKKVSFSANINGSDIQASNGYITSANLWSVTSYWYGGFIDVSSYKGGTCTITKNTNGKNIIYAFVKSKPTIDGSSIAFATGYSGRVTSSTNVTCTIPTDAAYLYVYMHSDSSGEFTPSSVALALNTETTLAQAGYVGGGTNGAGYTSYYGTQTSAGVSGSFGNGGKQSSSGGRYAGGAGGGGWYGGGCGSNNLISMEGVKLSGGGSGFVNTAASAGNRPSGYTGLQLDSGTTYAGNTSFPSTGGGTETGHSGDGYIRITRIS